jgi:hypothetical protein
MEVVLVSTEADGLAAAAAGVRRGQNVTRARRRRRRPNITDGVRHKVEVVLSTAEYETVKAAATEAGSTVPWYLVQCATTPLPASSGGEAGSGKSGPWLPWPKRQALAAALVSATGALDEVRLEQLSKIGSNLNQIAQAANIGGTVADEVLDTAAEVREAIAELRERAERLEELARQVTRR